MDKPIENLAVTAEEVLDMLVEVVAQCGPLRVDLTSARPDGQMLIDGDPESEDHLIFRYVEAE